jgi:hypothetical protein
MGSVTGCGRRQLIETNVCPKNRRVVDVRGVIVLGVAGITEPVEITLGELDLSTSVRARDSKAQKIRDVSQLTTGLSGCGVRAVDGREFNHEVAFPFNRKEAAEALAAPVRALRRINPDCRYEVESLSSEERQTMKRSIRSRRV